MPVALICQKRFIFFFSRDGEMFASIPIPDLFADGICQKLPRIDGPWSHVAGSRLRQLSAVPVLGHLALSLHVHVGDYTSAGLFFLNN